MNSIYSELLESLFSSKSTERFTSITNLAKLLGDYHQKSDRKISFTFSRDDLQEDLSYKNSIEHSPRNISSSKHNPSYRYRSDNQGKNFEPPYDEIGKLVFKYFNFEVERFLSTYISPFVENRSTSSPQNKSHIALERAFSKLEKISETIKTTLLLTFPRQKPKSLKLIVKNIIRTLSTNTDGISFLYDQSFSKLFFSSRSDHSQNSNTTATKNFYELCNQVYKTDKLSKRSVTSKNLSMLIESLYAKLLREFASTERNVYELSKTANWDQLIQISINILLKNARFNRVYDNPNINNIETDFSFILSRLMYKSINFRFGPSEKLIFDFSLIFTGEMYFLSNTSKLESSLYFCLLALLKVLYHYSCDSFAFCDPSRLEAINHILCNTLTVMNKNLSQKTSNLITKIWWVCVRLIFVNLDSSNTEIISSLSSMYTVLTQNSKFLRSDSLDFGAIEPYILENIIKYSTPTQEVHIDPDLQKSKSKPKPTFDPRLSIYNSSETWSDPRLLNSFFFSKIDTTASKKNQLDLSRSFFFSVDILDDENLLPELKWSNFGWFYYDLVSYLLVFLKDDPVTYERSSFTLQVRKPLKRKRNQVKNGKKHYEYNQKPFAVLQDPLDSSLDFTSLTSMSGEISTQNELVSDGDINGQILVNKFLEEALTELSSYKQLSSRSATNILSLLLNYSDTLFEISGDLLLQIYSELLKYISEFQESLRSINVSLLLVFTRIINISNKFPNSFANLINKNGCGQSVFTKLTSSNSSDSHLIKAASSVFALNLIQIQRKSKHYAIDNSNLFSTFKNIWSEIQNCQSHQLFLLSLTWTQILIELWPFLRASSPNIDSIDCLFHSIVLYFNPNNFWSSELSWLSSSNSYNQIETLVDYSKTALSTLNLIVNDQGNEKLEKMPNIFQFNNQIINTIVNTLDNSELDSLVCKIMEFLKKRENLSNFRLLAFFTALLEKVENLSHLQNTIHYQCSTVSLETFLLERWKHAINHCDYIEFFFLSEALSLSYNLISKAILKEKNQKDSFVSIFAEKLIFFMTKEAENSPFMPDFQYNKEIRISTDYNDRSDSDDFVPGRKFMFVCNTDLYKGVFKVSELLLRKNKVYQEKLYDKIIVFLENLEFSHNILAVSYKLAIISRYLDEIFENEIPRTICSLLSKVLLDSTYLESLDALSVVYKSLGSVFPQLLLNKLSFAIDPSIQSNFETGDANTEKKVNKKQIRTYDDEISETNKMLANLSMETHPSQCSGRFKFSLNIHTV
ncbi:hypothetical protein BB560_001892 [Smittium megazygosporum]|uniref:Uncharacterized protein n=1 Tax=Smittium megazygosporum TaxID=133381 RepID=A0A2T9ZGA7_9FUNG|nr:hypothetical protein BB560_001892 [Smittium megazygosporum]